MDTLLYNGDHYTDGRGLTVQLSGGEELVQRILIRLQVRKGAFVPDPGLGSELYRLRRDAGEHNTRVAMGYVQEALADMPGVTVQRVTLSLEEPDRLLVSVTVQAQQESYQLEVTA